MKIKGLAAIAALGLALNLPFSTDATAGLILTLGDGTNSVTVNDNGVGDMSTTIGDIAYFSGSFGVWNFNLTAGLSDSPIGGLRLNSTVKSDAAGTLTVTLLDHSFISPTGSRASGSITGATDGSVDFMSYVDGIEVARFESLTGEFAASASTAVATGSPYSIMAAATIVHTGAGETAFLSSVAVPEPATLALLGVGLLLLGATSRRKRRS